MSSEREERAGLTKLRQTYERMNDAAIRQTERGWRFYDNQGRSFELSPTEGAELHKAGQTRVDELMRSLNGNSWLILIPAVLTIMLGMRMAAEFEAVGAMPTALYFVPCLLFFLQRYHCRDRVCLLRNEMAGSAGRYLPPTRRPRA